MHIGIASISRPARFVHGLRSYAPMPKQTVLPNQHPKALSDKPTKKFSLKQKPPSSQSGVDGRQSTLPATHTPRNIAVPAVFCDWSHGANSSSGAWPNHTSNAVPLNSELSTSAASNARRIRLHRAAEDNAPVGEGFEPSSGVCGADAIVSAGQPL
jgi:hypothetical protein